MARTRKTLQRGQKAHPQKTSSYEIGSKIVIGPSVHAVVKQKAGPKEAPAGVKVRLGEFKEFILPKSLFHHERLTVDPDPSKLTDSPVKSDPLVATPTSEDNRHPEKPDDGAKMLEDDRIITKEGVRYFPLSLAAQQAQVPRQTLLNWIKSKKLFDGQPLQSYKSPTAGKFYVTEDSIRRMADRFVEWPSQKPAGRVTIGATADHTGFLGISDAAQIIGISPRTMWVWASQPGKAPTDKPLGVIKCTTSDQFYIRERDVSALRTFVPRSGLQRGRRTQPVLQL